MYQGYAAFAAKGELKPFEYDPGVLGETQVEIAVEYCGICHSDLSMLDNEWGMTQYPFVPGHEVVGRIVAVGEQVTSRKVGQRVGLGWYAGSCMSCEQCLNGDHNLCLRSESTIVGRHGGFADKVRCSAEWATPLPGGIDVASAGPLFCGGITVFNPIVQFGVKPTDRVGVIGIGGLGHLALQFLRAWGCEVTAFSGSADKEQEARDFGAEHFVNSRDPQALQGIAGTLDFIISTVNAPLNWDAYLAALKPKGRLHFVGAVVAKPIEFALFPLLGGQKQLSGSPLGSPATTALMLEFAARHDIKPMVEIFPFHQVNDAMEKLKSGAPRYRLVLKN